MSKELYFKKSLIQTDKIKYLFINSDIKNTKGNKDYLSLIRNIGVVKYSERSSSGNKTSDSPEKYKLVNIGDLVVNPMNVTIGSVGVSKYKGCLSGVYIVLTPKKNVNSNYYHYVFSNKEFQKYLKTISYGIMEIRESLNKTEFFQLKVPNPSIKEQSQIASYLDSKTQKINKLFIKIKKKIELLKEHKDSIISEVVTKGIESNVKMINSNVEWIGNVPKHWKIRRLAVIGKFSKGKNITKQDLTETGYPVILYSHLYTSYEQTTSKIIYFISKENAYTKTIISNGSILFTSSGETIEEIGKTLLYNGNEKVAIGGDIVIFQLNNKSENNLEFFSYFLNSKICQDKKSSMSRGDIVVHIYKKQIREIRMCIPPKKEQDMIVKYLDEQISIINKTILKEEKKMELLNEYRQSIISEVVMGKKKVNEVTL